MRAESGDNSRQAGEPREDRQSTHAPGRPGGLFKQ